MGFGPTTFCLEGRRSTPELHPHQETTDLLNPLAHQSGRVDLNHRPLEPKSSALTGLRHAPNDAKYTSEAPTRQNVRRVASDRRRWRSAGWRLSPV